VRGSKNPDRENCGFAEPWSRSVATNARTALESFVKEGERTLLWPVVDSALNHWGVRPSIVNFLCCESAVFIQGQMPGCYLNVQEVRYA
jgi:hypothetical protein